MKTVLLLCALIVGSGNLWADPVQLFHETFGTGSSKARNWDEAYSVKTGVSSVYSDISSYTISNAKQSNSSAGSTGAGLTQTTTGTDAYIIIGPLDVHSYQSMTLTYQWKAGSVKNNTYYSKLYYKTSSTGTFTEISGTGNGATTYVERSYSLPAAAQVSTLYLKIVWNTSNTNALIDEVNLAGTASTSPSISLGTSSVNATATGGDGTIDVTYNYIASVDAEVKFYESDGTTAATYDWLDAEINKDNNLYYVIGANTGDARTAYMKVHQKNTEVYSSLITITQSAPVVVTLDLSSNTGWSFPSGSSNKTEGINTYTKNGYSITLSGPSDQGYYFDSSNLLLGKSGASLTLPAFGFNVTKIKVYGTSGASGSVKFNIYVGNDAVSTEVTSSKVDHEFAIDAEKQGVGTVYVIKVTSTDNMRITKIEIYGNGCEAGLVGAAGWATYVTESPVTYAEGDAFAVTSVGTSVELTSVTSVPTGTPLLLKGAGQKTAILLDAEPSDITNKLAVSDGSNGVNDYVLYNGSNGVGFYKWTGSALASGKVYLPASAVAGAREFLGFDDETTGIANVKGEAKTLVNSDFYNIAGQRVAQPTKGLYIVNGKKVIIK